MYLHISSTYDLHLLISKPGPLAWTIQQSCICVCKLLMAPLFLTSTARKSLSASNYCGGVTVRFSRCEIIAVLAVIVLIRMVRHFTDSSVESNSLSCLIANDCVHYFPPEILPNPVVTLGYVVFALQFTGNGVEHPDKTLLLGVLGGGRYFIR